jgi:hypothetical protein
MEKRFLIIELAMNSMTVADEAQVSNRVDMDDCIDLPFRLMYLTDRGDMVPVSTGEYRKCNSESANSCGIHAYSSLMVEGKKVGTVQHTDH